MIQERWRPIQKWEGYYEISDFGKIRRVDRIGLRAASDARAGGRLLRQRLLGDYLSCDLRSPGRKQRVRTHVLLLQTFVSARPQGMVACHNNGNKLDNRLLNLRWDTLKGNSIDNRFHGTHVYGEKCARAVLMEAEAREILEAEGLHREIAAKYGVSRPTVTAIKSGRNWPYLRKSPTDGFAPRVAP